MLQLNRNEIETIKEKANENLEIIFDYFNIPYNVGHDSQIRCNCPIHDGDNPTAFCFDVEKGFWACYTNHCEDGVGKDIIGLVQKMLSKEKETSFLDTLYWLKKKLSIETIAIYENNETTALDRLIHKDKIVQRAIHQKPKYQESRDFPFEVSKIRNKITPSEYFLSQGFSSGILNKFMVGFCDNPIKPMYLRSFAPILDTTGNNVIGVTGRINLEKCEFCNQYHVQGKGCPVDDPKIKVYPKWFHYGFATSSNLYNDWNAEKFIKNTGKIVVCEGTKNVWWLEQHDINISTCVYGLKILPYHLKRFLEMGVRTLILGFDKDENERGQNASQKIKEDLSNYFKIVDLNQFLEDGKDIANLDKDKLKEIKKYIEKI